MKDIEGWFSNNEHGCLMNLAEKVARPGCVFVEVGTYKGRSTQALARVASEWGGMVYCVDNWKISGKYEEPQMNYMGAFCDNMKDLGYRDNVAIMFMDSLWASRVFRDAGADLVFIDASHRYLDVVSDIDFWRPKVRPGGLLVGHDVEERWADPRVQECALRNNENDDMICIPSPPGFLPFCCHVNVIRAVTEAFGEDYEREGVGNTLWWRPC